MIISAGTACISQKKKQSVGAGFVHGSFELRYPTRKTLENILG